MKKPLVLVGLLLVGCGPSTRKGGTRPTPSPTPSAAASLIQPGEGHLATLKQLTFGGENAEAYWTPDDQALLFQTTRPPFGCDVIMRTPADGATPPVLVSSGKGRTTCAYTYPDQRVLYASTHLAGDACPPVPDHSQGYVWPLYDSYEIFTANADGSGVAQLTKSPGYDAEATICRSGKDSGAIIFTSTRDGDIELYRMNADGSDVKRLTSAPGYDGGAFFSADCSQIVWRASRPAPGPELDDFRRLLGQGLVRPTRLELFVADADGTNARQVTYLDAASFAPYFFPDGKRIIFSSNYSPGGKPGREFDIWAINVDGSQLERITTAPGFDGFPMFSSDGKRLAFSSNRNQKKEGDTDLFVAEWRDVAASAGSGASADVREWTPADRFAADVAWLADDARGGRGVGSPGLEEARAYIERRFKDLGLSPVGPESFSLPFSITTGVEVEAATSIKLDGKAIERAQFEPAPYSASATVSAEVVFAGYGITAPELKVDDYKGIKAKGKIVVVRRFTPEGGEFANDRPRRQYSEVKYKAFNARQHGAIGLIVVDLPEVAKGVPLPAEAALPPPDAIQPSDEGLPIVLVSRAAGAGLVGKGKHRAELTVALKRKQATAYNVVGRISAGKKTSNAVVIGAHYDHLGMGGHGSLAPGVDAPHNGADDNASGVAALLEVARVLSARRAELPRDVVLIAFAGEELGVLGSTALMRSPPERLAPGDIVAMLNMDMVGRLRDGKLQVLGGDSAPEWAELVQPACAAAGLACNVTGGGFGPSDQTPFYGAGVPVLHFFTGSHAQYHTPDDDAALINAGGGAHVAALVAEVALATAKLGQLTYKSAPSPMALGDSRGGASLGTIPDYAGAPGGKAGVFLAGVRPGGPAEKAGIVKGDLVVKIGEVEIRSVEDLMFVLRAAMPGQKTKVVVLRGDKPVEVEVVYGQSVRR